MARIPFARVYDSGNTYCGRCHGNVLSVKFAPRARPVRSRKLSEGLAVQATIQCSAQAVAQAQRTICIRNRNNNVCA
eukprot:5857433-Amphidinium_carterae.1